MFKCVLISYMSTYMSKGGSQVLQNFEGELLRGECVGGGGAGGGGGGGGG